MLSPKVSQHCSNLGVCESEIPAQQHQRLKKNGGHLRNHNTNQKLQQSQTQSQHQLHTNINRRGSTSNVLPQHMTTLKKSYSIANNSTLRRKSSLCYQQQLINSKSVNCSTDALNNSNTEILPARYCPHPNELFPHHQHGKLSLQPIERYDDSLACCLPPPSPAPNSDRFIGGTCIISPLNSQAQSETHHQQPQNYQQQHTLSSSTSNSSLSTGVESCSSSSTTGPLSAAFQTVPCHQGGKYNANPPLNMNRSVSPTTTRFCMNSERYRDLNASASINTATTSGSAVMPSTTRLSSSTTHFPYQNCTTPLVSTDTYSSYLASTVHTPIKRYVPTPPPQSQLLASDQNHTQQPTIQTPTLSTGSSSVIGTKCGGSINSSSGVAACSSPTIPYRMRPLKCCASDQMADHQAIVNQTSDLYSSSSRLRNAYNCNKTMNEVQTTNQPQPLNKNVNMMATQSSLTTQTHMVATIMGCGGANSPQTNAKTTNGVRKQIPAYTTRSNLYSTMIDLQEPNRANQTTSNNITDLNQSNGCISTTLRNEEANPSSSAAVGSGSSSTCLHCKTVRRTTGVHQTTQTTGPISPVPQMAPSLTVNNQRFNDQLANITMTLTPTLTESKQLAPFTPPSTSIPTNCLLTKKLDMAQDQMFATQLKASSNQILQSNLNESNKNLQQSPNMEHFAPTSRSLNQPQASQQLSQPQSTTMVQQQQQQQRYSCKKRVTQYLRREILRFFGIETSTEANDYIMWQGRQRRLALRRFGSIKPECELQAELSDVCPIENSGSIPRNGVHCSGFTNESQHNHYYHHQHSHSHHYATERPDILPIQDIEDGEIILSGGGARYNGGAANGGSGRRGRCQRDQHYHPHFNADILVGDHIERKASVASMIVSSFSFIKHSLNKRQSAGFKRRQWSRSFAPAHVQYHINNDGQATSNEFYEGLSALQDDEVFFDSPVGVDANGVMGSGLGNSGTGNGSGNTAPSSNSTLRITSVERQLFISGERGQQGWRTSNIIGQHDGSIAVHQPIVVHSTAEQQISQQQQQHLMQHQHLHGVRGNRISAQLLDGVLENSQRPVVQRIRKFCANDLDDRTDHRPFFTYWINTVQIIVLFLSLMCYGIGPIGFGVEQRTGQVLVPSLSLQTVQHSEQRNVWIGPRSQDLVHMGAKFATCMRRDVKIIDVLMKTRRQERETACCIRNDDSGCVQSSQADCSVRGLFPTKSISTWKKWSPGESGPGGRISGSVCGLDPKYCDAPASIAPYEWPDDITKWPICRKTNSFSQRFRFKDHTAEHMVCEVIGHPCCKGIYGECQITTREYCDFVNGNFHEEASLCSQISCLSNVCGMFPFVNVEVPDQFYRLLTSLCMHAGIVHLVITVIFQHVFLADLERLIGPIRTAILYIGSGLAGNLTSAVLVPYEPEVGPLASLSGVIASLVVLLILAHWEQLHKPHIALFKLIIIGAILFAVGTLPWQLNFAGLFAGIFCGIFLTIALVPFLSIKKYRRKSKINLIWSCIIFHIFIYATMLIIFYIFPTELTKLSFGEVLTNSFYTGVTDGMGGIGATTGSPAVISTDIMRTGIGNNNNINRHSFMQQQSQYHYHHHSDDIITNTVPLATTNLAVGGNGISMGNESGGISKVAVSL